MKDANDPIDLVEPAGERVPLDIYDTPAPAKKAYVAPGDKFGLPTDNTADLGAAGVRVVDDLVELPYPRGFFHWPAEEREGLAAENARRQYAREDRARSQMNGGVRPEAPPPSGDGRGEEAPAKPVVMHRFVWRNPAMIPRRQFIYNRHSARGFVSLTGAVGGVGKTGLLLAESLSLVTGSTLLAGDKMAPGKTDVWFLGLEDPLVEYERRIAAIALHHRVPPETIEAGFHLDSGRDQDFIMAVETRDGVKIIEPVVDSIIANIRQGGVGLLVVDPFVACHAVSENDNVRLEKVMKKWAYIAQVTDCGVELVAHLHKGSNGEEPNAELLRGASSIGNAARSVRILTGMSKEQAKEVGKERDRSKFFSVAYGIKPNLSPPPETLDWIEMKSVPLGNGDGEDEPGDVVGAATRFRFNPLGDLSVDDLRAAQRSVAGGKWRADSQAKDWVGNPIAEALGLDPHDKDARASVKKTLEMWIANGMFKSVKGADAKRRPKDFIEVGTRADD